MASRKQRDQSREGLSLLEHLAVSCALALAATVIGNMVVLNARASALADNSVSAAPLPSPFESIRLPLVWQTPAVNPYTGLALIPEPIRPPKKQGVQSISIVREARPAQRSITMPGGDLLILDYENKAMLYKGRVIPAIVDPPENCTDCGPTNAPQVRDMMTQRVDTVWVHLAYDRFDVYIEEGYYNRNTANLIDFWDKFEPRHELMEQTTNWSSEKFYGQKLKIHVLATTGCWGGHAYSAEANLTLSDPFYNPICARPYYENGELRYNNPGELGDNWVYMTGALHEALHSINPMAIYSRLWLTEGFSEYNEYNILSQYGAGAYSTLPPGQPSQVV